MPDPEPDGGVWRIDSLEDARFVINVLSRRTVRDAEELTRLADRIRALEAPLHRRIWRRIRG